MSDSPAVPPAHPPAGLPIVLRLQLSAMMFLQYALWGAWWVVVAIYMIELNFEGWQIGMVYGTTAIASIFAPLVFGQIADRWVPTQYLLVALHLGGAGMLVMITRFTDFWPFYWCVLIWAFLFIPTISLTNALSFHHLPDAAKDFPGIRVMGTIGWIVAGLLVGWLLDDTTTQPIKLAAVISFVMGLYCLLLPHTPPTGKAGDALPFVKAVSLLKHGNFALFIFVSFILSIVLAGYFSFTPPFLKSDAVDIERIAPVASIMTVGQFTEMLLLPFLPFFIKSFGMKRTLALGMAAWGVRYGIFALELPTVAIILGIALHGICYDFFFVAAYIHVDNQATRDMRASAQALFNIVTMGFGMWLGNMFFGKLKDAYTLAANTPEETTDWSMFWAIPAIGVALALVVFLVGFPRDRKKTGKSEAS